MFNTPDPFAPGYRLTDGNQLNYQVANPSWSVSDPVSATVGGTAQTSTPITYTITNIATVNAAGAGVTLPQALPGRVLMVINNGLNDARIFAAGNSTINGTAGVIGILLQKGTTALFSAVATQQWSLLSLSGGGSGGVGPTGPNGPTGPTGPASTASAAGTTGSVQFNASGILGADSNFYWDNTNKRLGIGTSSPHTILDVDASGADSAIYGNATGTGDGVIGQANSGYAGNFIGKLKSSGVYNNLITGRNVTINSAGEFGYGTATSGITVINTIADLRASTVTNGQVVYVAGYYHPGDGGGGYFVGLTGSVNFNDNGGTRITTGYGVGSTSVWIRGYYPTGSSYILGNDPMSVLYFGAYGDGTNASTTRLAIQNAIDAVAATGRGGTVYFPAGQYAIDATITLSSPKITLAGDNVRASQIITSSSSINMVSITGIDTAKVQDLTLYRSVAPASQTVCGFSITSAANVTFSFVSSDNSGSGFYSNNSSVQFFNCRAYRDIGSGIFYGWFFDSTNGNPNPSCYVADSTTNVQPPFSGTAYGIFAYGQQVKDLFIKGYEFACPASTAPYTAVSNGIWIEATQTSGSYQNNFDITIVDCIIDTYKGEGIVLAFLSSAAVSNCWTNPTVGPSSYSTVGIRVQTSSSVTITGCEFFAGGNFANHVGLKLATTYVSNVTGNTFLNSLVDIGIDTASTANTITGNSFSNAASQPAFAQIQIAGSRNVVSSNVMYGSATYAIQVNSPAGYNLLSLNSTNGLPISIYAGGGTNQSVNNI